MLLIDIICLSLLISSFVQVGEAEDPSEVMSVDVEAGGVSIPEEWAENWQTRYEDVHGGNGKTAGIKTSDEFISTHCALVDNIALVCLCFSPEN